MYDFERWKVRLVCVGKFNFIKQIEFVIILLLEIIKLK